MYYCCYGGSVACQVLIPRAKPVATLPHLPQVKVEFVCCDGRWRVYRSTDNRLYVVDSVTGEVRVYELR